MPSPDIYALLSVVIVSGLSLVGVFTLSLKEDLVRKYVFVLVSLAVGALLGDAFIHLIPEVFENTSAPLATSLLIIAGIIVFFILEKFLHWHHHDASGEHAAEHPHGRMILVSDGVHNFIDGLIIGASYLVSVEVGIATTIAIILHEIPQEIGDFGVLLHAGYTKSRALLLNFLSALLAIGGTLVALLLGGNTDTLTGILVPLAAGGFIYVALSDLIPELHQSHYRKYTLVQILAIGVGIGAMLLLLFVE